ncbi:acyloxyacyl hydrolase [Carboxylicivirga marina]|uniref:acyloxyacyl hydrolase n=1 Tax=Carboxylicivirga marina TaxID=2800988 RepID=UPI002593B055|nr:acyloxyacyl hydrolase [uncultured Carboxylicivirga sp.]
MSYIGKMTMPKLNIYLSMQLFLMSVIGITAMAQTNQSEAPVFYASSLYYGKFQVHTKSLYPYNGTNPYGVEFEISRFLLSENIRERFGTFIKWGIGLNYVNFDHSDLGYSISSVAYIEPFIKPRGRWRYSLKLGSGLAYMSHPYDEISNPQNLTYSTRFAFPLFGGFSAYYFIRKQLAIKATASFQHISNGGIKQPNLGINYPALALGVEFTNQHYTIPPKKKLLQYNKETRLDVLVGYSLKEDTTNTNNQNVVTLFINQNWQVSRINAINVSAMFEYHQLADSYGEAEQWSVAPLVGNEFLLGQLRFGQQIGLYIVKGAKAPNDVLQNYYLRYKVNSRLMAGVNLKAHGRVADYLSFQLGLMF